jgi:hypothetical protein
MFIAKTAQPNEATTMTPPMAIFTQGNRGISIDPCDPNPTLSEGRSWHQRDRIRRLAMRNQ